MHYMYGNNRGVCDCTSTEAFESFEVGLAEKQEPMVKLQGNVFCQKSDQTCSNSLN